MNASRTRFLLIVLVILVAIQYLLLPFLDWQTSAADRLAVLTNKLDRATGVVENRESILKSHKMLQEKLQPLQRVFPVASDSSAAQLSVQEDINSRLNARDVRLETFDWVVTGSVKGTPLSFSRFQLRVTGEVRQLALFLAEIETDMPYAFIRDVSGQPQQAFLRGPEPGNLLQANIVADVYYSARPKK